MTPLIEAGGSGIRIKGGMAMTRSIAKLFRRDAAGGSPLWVPILLVGIVLVGLHAQPIAAQDEAPVETTLDPAEAPIVGASFGVDLDRVNRALVGPSDTFSPDVERIFCMTRIQGLTPPTTITHAWYHEGQSKARVELNVGSPDWRTWSSKRILPAWTGVWEVKVLDETGKVLATFGFVVE